MSRFDLEQEIMNCWNVTSDIKTIAGHVNDGSDYTIALIGLAQLYECKFEQLWNAFEKMIADERKKDE